MSSVAPARVLPWRDVLRFPRLITLPACRSDPHCLPLSAVVAMCGVSGLALYRMRWTGRASDDMAELLTPAGAPRFEAGNLRGRRNGRLGDGANRWEIIEK